MTPNDQLLAPSPAEALNNLLDHADLLAVITVAIDGLLSRGDVIADTLAEAVGELIWRRS